MLGYVSSRNAGKTFTVELTDRIAESRCGDDSVEPAMVHRDIFANRPQIGRRWHVHPAPDPDPGRGDFEIQPGAFVPCEPSGGKVRCNVRLERPLVGAEARIA